MSKGPKGSRHGTALLNKKSHPVLELQLEDSWSEVWTKNRVLMQKEHPVPCRQFLIQLDNNEPLSQLRRLTSHCALTKQSIRLYCRGENSSCGSYSFLEIPAAIEPNNVAVTLRSFLKYPLEKEPFHPLDLRFLRSSARMLFQWKDVSICHLAKSHQDLEKVSERACDQGRKICFHEKREIEGPPIKVSKKSGDEIRVDYRSLQHHSDFFSLVKELVKLFDSPCFCHFCFLKLSEFEILGFNVKVYKKLLYSAT